MNITETIQKLNEQIAAAEESIVKSKEDIRKARLKIRKLQTLHTKATDILNENESAEEVAAADKEDLFA